MRVIEVYDVKFSNNKNEKKLILSKFWKLEIQHLNIILAQINVYTYTGLPQ